jgi:hypothetical protein
VKLECRVEITHEVANRVAFKDYQKEICSVVQTDDSQNTIYDKFLDWILDQS